MSTLDSGKLRHRVTLQEPIRKQDPSTGEVTTEWGDVAKLWASVEPLSAREFIAAQAGQSQVSARIVIRYRAGVNATQRILFRGEVYGIHGVLSDVSSGLEYLTLPVSKGVSDGR